MTIALLTDFGPGSIYVGQMKAVIAGIVPHFPLIDLCHDIPPGPPAAIIGEGAFLLERSRGYLPKTTIVAAVVDPGVGTERRVLLAEVGQQILIGPDNGLLAPALEAAKDAHIIAVTEERWYLPERSRTFHGRDVFAALAAHVGRGLRWTTLGPRIRLEEVVRLDDAPTATRGRVRSIDRWGTLITDIAPAGGRLDAIGALVLAGGARVTARAGTFAEAPGEGPFVMIGGLGTVEIACRSASAAVALGPLAVRGAVVEVEPA